MSEASMLATLKMSIVKPGTSRNYEDLLTIKTYMYTIDFFKELFSSLSFLQIDELCRWLDIPNTYCDTYIWWTRTLQILSLWIIQLRSACLRAAQSRGQVLCYCRRKLWYIKESFSRGNCWWIRGPSSAYMQTGTGSRDNQTSFNFSWPAI